MPWDEEGLTTQQAKENLAKFGPNVLPEKPPPSPFGIFISQLKSPLVYVLLVALVVTLFLRDFEDALIIGLAVLINTVFGFIQELRANNALVALKKMLHPRTQVIRDGKLFEIDTSQVVPGDVVVLKQGDKISADGKFVAANRLFVDEAALTGESVPVAKNKNDEGFMGTIIASGQGRMEVSKTGPATQMGKIAQSVQVISIDTPLRRELSRFSKQLLFIAIGLVGFVFVLGLLLGKPILEIFTTSVALAVSAIPEGLLVSLTVVLAIGMQRILKRRGLVRNLVSAETLGGVTTICTDKTGTLTEGKMVVSKVLGNKSELARQAFLANDLDDPMVVTAFEWSKGQVANHESLVTNHKRIDSIPFTSENRYFASLHKNHGNNILFVNGAPEYLISWSNLSKKEKAKLLSLVDELTNTGYRLVGFARKEMSSRKTKIESEDVKQDLEWVGMLAFLDPIRKGVSEALQKTQTAGIKLIVITGDYPQTARFIMSQLGITVSDTAILLGEELERMSELELRHKLKGEERIILFARTTPHQKLKIVESLKANGEVIAMMGDGVNDAPALAKADIGIVVEDATDVAKESADLVLLDSSFETIVASVEEGRGIFDNVRKIILYLLCDGFEEIVAVILALLVGLPLPVTAAQILWINIVSDGFPSIALTVDPKRTDAMKSPPRDTRDHLVSPWMRTLVVIVSLFGGVSAMVLFFLTLNRTSDLNLARSVAFAALGVNSLIFVFSVRNLSEPFWQSNILRNKWLVLAVLAGLMLQIAPFLTSGLRAYFELSVLNLTQWMSVIGASLVMFALIETSKVLLRQGGDKEWRIKD